MSLAVSSGARSARWPDRLDGRDDCTAGAGCLTFSDAMSPLRIALATRCLGLPLRGSLLAASSFGAAGVQLDVRDELKPGDLSETGRRQFLHQLEESGLSVASVAFPLRRALFDQEHLDARV